MMPVRNRNYDMDADVTSDESYDSDQIDSDIEAELYSSIHHEEVSTEHKDNPVIKQNSTINLISVEENRIFEEKESLSPCNKFDMHFGFSFEKRKSNDKQLVENANVGLKRKSNLIAKVLDNIQVQSESPSKKQKTVNYVNRTRHSTSSTGNVTIEISDSDSSVILSEPDESSIQKLQTNIETFCFVSSDSECSLTFLSENNVDLDFNRSRNNNLNGNYKDVWKINDTDLYRTKRRSGRYHENAVANCTNCNKKGHVARFCTEPKAMKCIVCGGMHLHSHCKRRVCIKCLRFGHNSKRCNFPVDNILCSICDMRGHGKKCCPDLWRRYHLTTSGGRIVKGQLQYQTAHAYCCNCGLEGHFGFQCDKSRMDRWSYPTWSSVISYENPEGFVASFQRNVKFEGNIPETQQPIPTHQIASRLNPIEKRKFFRNQKNRQKKLRKKQNKSQKNNVQNEGFNQQPGVNSSFLSNSNFGHGNVRVKQKVDFPRTPKVSQSQCVDEMPELKQTRRRRNRIRQRKKGMLQGKQM